LETAQKLADSTNVSETTFSADQAQDAESDGETPEFLVEIYQFFLKTG
jgi:hypothetical protein